MWDVATTAASGTTVTPKDNGHTVTLKPGGRLTISLKDNNPSTGYSSSYKTKPRQGSGACLRPNRLRAVGRHRRPTAENDHLPCGGEGKHASVARAAWPGSGTEPTATLALTVDVN